MKTLSILLLLVLNAPFVSAEEPLLKLPDTFEKLKVLKDQLEQDYANAEAENDAMKMGQAQAKLDFLYKNIKNHTIQKMVWQKEQKEYARLFAGAKKPKKDHWIIGSWHTLATRDMTFTLAGKILFDDDKTLSNLLWVPIHDSDDVVIRHHESYFSLVVRKGPDQFEMLYGDVPTTFGRTNSSSGQNSVDLKIPNKRVETSGRSVPSHK